MCSTITPPLHLEVILPMTGSFASYAFSNSYHPFIFLALVAETTTSPFLSSIFSSRTGTFEPSFILSKILILLISFISKTGSDLSPSINKKTNLSVIFVTIPSIILPSSIFIFDN